MNHGYFYSLDIDASQLDEGIAVFRYTDLPAYLHQKHYVSPQYPVAVIITGQSVKFIVHYCVHHSVSDEQHLFFLEKPSNPFLKEPNIVHMEEVLFELPFSSAEGELASILKNIYATRFPINLNSQPEFDNEAIVPHSFANYMQFILSRRYETKDTTHSINCCYEKEDKSLEHFQRHDQKNNSYSSLTIWGLKGNDGLFQLHESNTTNYDKFLRKLFLDFLFDLVHSDVFKNSSYYEVMHKGLTSDFFFSAIARKSEFYFQRSLVCDRFQLKTDLNNEIHLIYAKYLDRAEKQWLECIQSSAAERFFNYTPNWFQSDKENTNWWIQMKERIRPRFRIRKHSWFVEPEEELRRVYFDLKVGDKKEESYSHNNQSSCELNEKWPIWNSGIFALITGGDKTHPEELNQRKRQSSLWLFKRYDFTDAFRLSFFPGANTIFLITLILFTFSLLLFPSFLAPETILRVSIGVGVAGITTVYIQGVNILCLQQEYSNHCTHQIRLKHQKKWFLTTLVLTCFYCGLWGICYLDLGGWWWGSTGFILFFIILWKGSMITRYLHFSFPRLIASITAAWFTIALSEDLFKAFFDSPFTWRTCMLISVIVFIFVLYEINRILPYSTPGKKLSRAFELILISFVLAVSVGLVVINFTGERFLERCGYLPDFFRHELLTGPIRADSLHIAWKEIDPEKAILQYSYTGQFPDYSDSIKANKITAAIRAFSKGRHEINYLDRLDILQREILNGNGDYSVQNIDSTEWRQFLLNHENPAIFRSLLKKVHHRESLWSGKHTLTLNWHIGAYDFFILRDFLLQFSFIAMFIGIFIQLVFEDKNIPES